MRFKGLVSFTIDADLVQKENTLLISHIKDMQRSLTRIYKIETPMYVFDLLTDITSSLSLSPRKFNYTIKDSVISYVGKHTCPDGQKGEICG